MQNLCAGFLEAFNGPTVKNGKLQVYLLHRDKNLYDFSQLSYMLQVKIKFRLNFFNLGWFSNSFVAKAWLFMN